MADEQSTRLSKLKVFSLNVHSWRTPDREPMEYIDGSVVDMVTTLQPDVCCFQEARHPHTGPFNEPTALSRIADGMNARQENVHFASTFSTTFGNATIFKANGTVESKLLRVGNYEDRAATKLDINTGHNWDFVVVNLHLDHLREQVRIEQLKIVLDWLNNGTEGGGSYLPHIIVGDFNAVSSWTEQVTEARAKHNLEPSTDALYNFLTHHRGYLDLEKVRPPRNTSVYNVRVDYIFCSPSLLPRMNLDQTHFDVLESRSDHSAIVGTIALRTDKLLVGVVCKDKDPFPDALRQLMLEKGVGGVCNEVVRDCSMISEKLQQFDCVVVYGIDFAVVLPSLDFLFHFDLAMNVDNFGVKGKGKVLRVSSVDDAFGHIQNYLHI